ncbi:MAG: polysulfide reductase chain A [Candidatus Thiodiazotropha sp. (ex Semelilucina semeliformis)]|nr:polysulfide reductase chain A [Candidatus Thiodiazotropha sp. (ex Myrtea spinifera)]MCU7807167.1 polysulfide reductase chain A [Candidatus Thiodiazotropha sp. (ex Semelilucina semeliformis)]MCU7829903.1 polysulfide reductase chain A [Candidatus Thiodiazotropha sp. (ex Myrtea sp. 'scaly one' KF741663)]
MRFPQVKTGQRFTYQGMQYTKTGPLTASEEGSGEQRMIMRSAEVALLDVTGKPEKSTRQQYTRSELEAEIQRFKTSLASGVKAAAEDDGTLQLEQVLALIECTEVND